MADPREFVARLNACWLDGRARDVETFLHPEVIVVFPGFEGRAVGREAVLKGFHEFCDSADILEYAESDHQVDVVATAAVVTYHFRMVFRRDGVDWGSRGRDLWILDRTHDGEGWHGVWRTLLELEEGPLVDEESS